MFTFGSLFSGCGGLDLGLERAGMTCRWQIENDPYCQRVLAKHWPDVPKYGDIHTVEGSQLEPVDLLCGGPPCQPVSVAGDHRGQDDARWLWPEFARLIRDLRPRFVLVENVPGLLVRGMGDVLGDLAACGYDAEWDCLPAAQFGAPHYRLRVFVVAYPSGEYRQARVFGTSGAGATLPRPCWGQDQPGVARSAYGVPHVVDRYRAIGNGVVPQVAQWIGERILAADSREEVSA